MNIKSPRQIATENGWITYASGKICPKGHLSDRYTKSGGCIECRAVGQQKQRTATLVSPKQSEMVSSRKEALSLGHSQYQSATPCKHGHISPRRTKTGECVMCRQIGVSAWFKRNPEKSVEYAKKYDDKIKQRYVKNKDKIAIRVKEYRKNNPAIHQARVRARQAAKAKRTAGWLTAEDKWLIDEIYDLAVLRTKLHGFSWHVDHIIPLRGKFVSGLHVPSNLQVIPWFDNVKKANGYKVQ